MSGSEEEDRGTLFDYFESQSEKKNQALPIACLCIIEGTPLG